MASCGWSPIGYDGIVAWCDRHPDAMPRTLSDLVRYPMAFRRVMVNRVAPEVRLQLWREHLEMFLRPEAGLSDAKQRMVETAIVELPEIFGAGRAPNPVMTDFERRMSEVFSRQEAAHLFMLIGGDEPPEGIPLPSDAMASGPR
jgi:hypothetical protein